MASKSYYQNENNTLTGLDTKLKDLVNKMKNINSDYNVLTNHINDNYYLDNSCVAVEKINEIGSYIDGEVDYINNTVIPAIASQIQANNAEIARIEAEEQAAKEAAEKAAAEKAAKEAAEKEAKENASQTTSTTTNDYLSYAPTSTYSYSSTYNSTSSTSSSSSTKKSTSSSSSTNKATTANNNGKKISLLDF